MESQSVFQAETQAKKFLLNRLPEDGVKGAERQVAHFRGRHPAAGPRGPRAARHHGLEVVREGGAERRGHRVEPQRRDVETLVEVLPRRLGRVVCRILGTVFISLTTPFVIMVMG